MSDETTATTPTTGLQESKWPREYGWPENPDDEFYQVDGRTMTEWDSDPDTLWTIRGYVKATPPSDDAGHALPEPVQSVMGSWRLTCAVYNLPDERLEDMRDKMMVQIETIVEGQLVELARRGMMEGLANEEGAFSVDVLFTYEPHAQRLSEAEMLASAEAHVPAQRRDAVRRVHLSQQDVLEESGEAVAATTAFTQLSVAMEKAGVHMPEPAEYNDALRYAEAVVDAMKAFERQRGYEEGQDPLVRHVAEVVARDRAGAAEGAQEIARLMAVNTVAALTQDLAEKLVAELPSWMLDQLIAQLALGDASGLPVELEEQMPKELMFQLAADLKAAQDQAAGAPTGAMFPQRGSDTLH